MATTTTAPKGGGTKSLLMQKRGPLPIWAWVALVLVLLLVFAWWRARGTNAAATAVATGDETPLPGDQSAPPIFIVPAGPAGPAGSPGPAGAPGPAGPPATVPPAPSGGGRDTPPATVPPPAPKPAPPAGVTVTVAKYTTKNPPWNSTLSGIFGHYKGKTTASNWQAIWNAPANAALRKKRGTAERIQPGDKIFVPGAR
jgi:hypothetical protein